MELPEIRSWLRFSKLELAPKRAVALVDHFGGPDAIFAASLSQLRSVEGLTGRAIEKILSPEPPSLDKDLEAIQEKEIDLLPICSDAYPSNLRQISDPPVVLFVRGELTESDRFSVAIVGSRRASIYGRSMSEKMSKDLANGGLTVISGGARGIDAAAHGGALAVGGRTIVVLGCGIDKVYPPEHVELFNRVTGSGAVVSEYAPGTPPEAWRFPARNRIISGLSLGLLVLQAPVGSGALITARYAYEQGKDVFALPGNVDDPRNQGCHDLIRDGAVLVESAEHIMMELGIDPEMKKTAQASIQLESFNDDERKLIEILSLQPKHVDQVIKESGLPSHKVSCTLTMLEMRGVVKRVPGNSYVRAL